MTYQTENVFARILRGEIPCQKVLENEHILAFQDIFPKAPVHILLVPKKAYEDSLDFSKRASSEEIVSFIRAISTLVGLYPILSDGYRLISNKGKNGEQEVPHFHLHILGGAPMGPIVATEHKK